MSLEFLITSLIVVAAPGTGVLYTLAAGLSRGTKASVVAAFGCTLGIVPHMLAAITGLAALLHTSALAFQTLKIAGIAYLLYMAWQTLDRSDFAWLTRPVRTVYCRVVLGRNPAPAPPNDARRETGVLKIEETAAPRSVRRTVVQAVLINFLNPKLSIFFFAFLPQFVSPGEPHALVRMLEMSAVFMGLTFAVFALYGAFAAAVRTHVISSPRVMTWMRRAFAGAFVGLGVKLALAER